MTDSPLITDVDARGVATLTLNRPQVHNAFDADLIARLGAEFAAFHRDYDLLLTPTQPTLPPTVETRYHSPEFDRWRHAAPYTVPFNLTGQPAASIPCGVSHSGLPIGLQIVGPRFADHLVLRASRAFESASQMPLAHPNLRASVEGLIAGN